MTAEARQNVRDVLTMWAYQTREYLSMARLVYWFDTLTGRNY